MLPQDGAWPRVRGYAIIILLLIPMEAFGEPVSHFNWFLPRSELFSPLFHVFYQSVIACLGLDLKYQK